jgi:Cellulase (glycosyl hydrolase family 5)
MHTKKRAENVALPKRPGNRRALIGTAIGILLTLVLGTVGGITIMTNHLFGVGAAPAKLLAGQETWQQGTSSLLFGANDASWQWSTHNLGNTPAIANAVKTAGVTVIRSPLRADDANARVAAIEGAGAQCLGILQPQDAEQVVRQLGNRCNLYEFMNEPDNGGPSVDAYSTSWNQVIPRLRAINPNASFIGPVVASPNIPYIQRFLTLAKNAGNLPDAVSFHMYPCTDMSIANCSAHFADYARETARVRAVVTAITGQNLPLCITEYNFSWKPGQTPNNDIFMHQFTVQSLQSMARAGVAMANQFDIASKAGNGTLDMVDTQTGQAKPQLKAIQTLVQKYGPGIQPAQDTAQQITDKPPQKNSAPAQQAANVPTGMLQDATLLGVQPISCGGTNQTNANDCTLVIQAKTAQTVVLTWWNQDNVPVNSLNILTSSDSTNGKNGAWQTTQIALASSAGGGAQMLSLQPPTWIKVVVQPTTQKKTAVRGILQLYSITLTNLTLTRH